MLHSSESEEQRTLFKWAALQTPAHPELALLYHIANEGKRRASTGARMRAEGLKRGVPDICLPVARGGYNALYIELKRADGGKVSEDQRTWLAALNAHGNRAVICHGWDEARREIENYISGGVTWDGASTTGPTATTRT